MSAQNQEVSQIVDHLFRREAGKLVATLTRIFGPAHIELAEDIVQDTLVTALDHWSTGPLPDNPAAWITQVAKRKAINEINRFNRAKQHLSEYSYSAESEAEVEEVFLEKEIKDSQLRMIFTCCHPSLAMESQIALTLKTLCGFSVKEVAKALLTNEATINKRLYRAKQKIRTNDLPFTIPTGNELEERLNTVELTLYLLFNEGYNSSHSQELIRKNLCAEAMRLTQLLTEHFAAKTDLFALLSLMCFHAARFEARIDQKGAIVIFEDQNRSRWNAELISAGVQYLSKSKQGSLFNEYHLEAGIAAEHCLAKSFDTTDWQSIYKQYELLYQVKKNPIIQLNLAIVQSKLTNIEDAIRQLESLLQDQELKNYHLLPATLGVFHLKLKQFDKAKEYFLSAKKLTDSQQEIDFFNQKLEECK